MRKSLFFAAVLLALAACTREREIDIPDADMSLVAKTESPAGTRTIVEGETHVYWEPGDEIAVFSGDKSGKFTSTLTNASATSTFMGSLGTDAWTEGMDLWAVYPYAEDAVFNGDAITTVLPSEQVARAGSFGKDMNLAIAHSTTSELQFYNVGGGVRFSLAEDGIQEVVLEGMDGETLAGKVTVGFQDGIPVVLDVTEGKSSISVVPSEGESFQKDAWYYFVAIPGTLEKGFKLHFHKADQLGVKVFDKVVTIKRSIYGKLTHADEGATYTTVSDENIVFKDDLVKSIVVKYFDTSGDEELSYREAAVVLSFLVDKSETRSDDGEGKVSIFAGTGITSFDELVYFTGLTRIEDGAFAGCTELTSITIPENISAIGDNAFKGCTNLESITLTSETPPSIGTDAFADTGDCPILVPPGAVETYVSAWSEYAERIAPTKYPVPEAVDLGLSVKWASFNLGASKPEEDGDFFAWGETEPYYITLDPLEWKEGKEKGYDWASYKWSMGSGSSLTKYCPNPWYGFDGFSDERFALDPEDDAAVAHLGGKWRMPLSSEFAELRDQCTWTWTTRNGVKGYEVTSNTNGNSIFLPNSGGWHHLSNWSAGQYGNFWTSSVIAGSPSNAYGVIYNYGEYYSSITFLADDRSAGLPVRPVYGDPVEPISVHVGSVSLDRSDIELTVGQSTRLLATVLPADATEKSLFWMSSDMSVATVSNNGSVAGAGAGTATITATTVEGRKVATCRVTVKDYPSSLPVPEMVDLGLSVKWGTFNLGASKPEESGDYFAWGETMPKAEYLESNYKWCNGSLNSLTKYCDTSSYGDNGFTDMKTELDPEDDAACVYLGDKWRMPTRSEFMELCNDCTWELTTRSGVQGYTVTGRNGNSVFIPLAGYRNAGFTPYQNIGEYWTSSLQTGSPRQAWHIASNLEKPLANGGQYQYGEIRYEGLTIRPVYGDRPVPVESITLDKEDVTLYVGETATLVATVLPENATDKTIRWSSDKESVVTVSQDGVIKAVGMNDIWGIGMDWATITATAVEGGKTATCNVIILAPPEAVDLGLSVKWASSNLGALNAADYGDYYAWGETEPYYSLRSPMTWNPDKEEKGYYFQNYRWSSDYKMTKYCTNPDTGYEGFTDGLTVLLPEDDAVVAKLGGHWRMPTRAEQEELRRDCTWEWTSMNGVNGYQVTGLNGNSIFLPAAGCYIMTTLNNANDGGYYWNTSLDPDNQISAFYTYFASSRVNESSNCCRPYGLSIRPVYAE